jgi:hypothetical protein
MKRVAIILACLLLSLATFCCIINNTRGYPANRRIFSLVIENEEILLTAAGELSKLHTGNTQTYVSTTQKNPLSVRSYHDRVYEGFESYGGFENYEGVYTVKYSDGKHIYKPMDNPAIEKIRMIAEIRSGHVYSILTEFDCGGRGFGSAMTTWGFIYSENDDYFDIISSDGSKEGNGWLRREEGGDNSAYYEKITEKFYYYENHY